MNLRIALIFPNINYLGKIIKVSLVPPLGLAYLAAVVEKAGYNVSVIDASALNLNDDKLMAKLKEFKPDVIGITTNILLSLQNLHLSRLIQRQMPTVKLVFGGPWASAVYEMLLRKSFCDYVIVGEGEHAFLELLKALEKGESPKKKSGISYLDPITKSVQLEPPRPIEDLDTLPFPAWHLFPSPKKYFFHTRKKVFYPITTSRGCPYQCNHCTKIIHGTRVRFRSVKNVINEIRYLKEKFSASELLIVDDNFTVNKKRAEKILDEIIRNNFKLLLNFGNGLRADTLNQHLIRKFKQAGTYFIAIGVESGNQQVVNKIGKNLDLNAVRRAAKLIKQEKLVLTTFFMIGHPFDTVKTMNDTINFAIEVDPDYPVFSKVTALPGTELYNLIKREGRFLSRFGAIAGYQRSKANFEIYDLKADDVDRMFKQAYRRFYFRPRKMLSLLTSMRTFVEFKYILTQGILIILNLLHLSQ
ncbi:MAG: B12-binding domain-containing radical SAM protein [Candidatus Helarchaeota archaeon]|nr:B12-binding domain-containing radical SAM protein [Candidatus Helarchaeota archaeon]